MESVLRRTIGVIFWSLTRAAKRLGQRQGPHYAAVLPFCLEKSWCECLEAWLLNGNPYVVLHVLGAHELTLWQQRRKLLVAVAQLQEAS